MRLSRIGLAVIVIVYLGFGLAYALKTPLWETPDEPAHFNYIRDLASGRGLPMLRVGDWDAAYLEKLKAAKFPPELPIDAVRYESHQPPLYYALAAPLSLVSRGLSLAHQVLILRLFSTFLGAVLIVIAYATARILFPNDQLFSLAVPAFVATVPQHIAMTAAINNDTLGEVILSAIVLLILKSLRDGPSTREGVLIGILLGFALLTKEAIYVAGVLVLAVALYQWSGQRTANRAQISNVRSVATTNVVYWLAGTYALALAISGWWFVRNAATYGGLDIVARKAHDAVVVGQPETAAWGLLGAIRHFGIVIFESFWAQFGWMGVLADDRTYTIFGVLSALAFLGLGLFFWRVWRESKVLSGFQKAALGLLALTPLLILAGLVQYNLKFMQPQGRYLFPALIPLGAFFVLGLREWFSPRYEAILWSLLYIYLLYVDYISLTKFIIPALT